MKFALIGAVAVAAAALVTPALAQDVASNPSYHRADNWQNATPMQTDNSAYRYHGGPKYND